MRYLLVLLVLSGCSQWDYSFNKNVSQAAGWPVYYKPNLDRPWDPKRPATLLDQAVSPKNNALVHCCGRLKHCETWQSPRC